MSTFTALVRRLFRLEDLLWAVVLLVIRPTAGGLFLEGGAPSALVIIAGMAFWIPGVAGEHGDDRPRSGMLLLISLGAATIIVDACLEQVGADPIWHLVYALTTVTFAAFVVAQHVLTGARAWLWLPARVRRVAAWPYLMALGDMVGEMTERIIDDQLHSTMSAPLAVDIFLLLVIYVVVLPLFYGFFVAAPRRLADSRETARVEVWMVRYLVGIGEAGLAVAVGALLRP